MRAVAIFTHIANVAASGVGLMAVAIAFPRALKFDVPLATTRFAKPETTPAAPTIVGAGVATVFEMNQTPMAFAIAVASVTPDGDMPEASMAAARRAPDVPRPI